MKTALLDIKTALYERLSKNSSLMISINGVFDNVTDEDDMPYVVLGENTVIDWGTKTNEGEEMTTTLHVWSDKQAKTETMKIINLILEALTTPLSLGSGFSIGFSKREFMEIFEDPSGYRHGVIRLRFKIKHN